MKKILLLTILFFIFSCSNEQSTKNDEVDAYTMMETAFEGYPSKSEFQPMARSS